MPHQTDTWTTSPGRESTIAMEVKVPTALCPNHAKNGSIVKVRVAHLGTWVKVGKLEVLHVIHWFEKKTSSVPHSKKTQLGIVHPLR